MLRKPRLFHSRPKFAQVREFRTQGILKRFQLLAGQIGAFHAFLRPLVYNAGTRLAMAEGEEISEKTGCLW